MAIVVAIGGRAVDDWTKQEGICGDGTGGMHGRLATWLSHLRSTGSKVPFGLVGAFLVQQVEMEAGEVGTMIPKVVSSVTKRRGAGKRYGKSKVVGKNTIVSQ